MLTVALVSQKGGSGKTTLALNLAIAAVKARKSVVVIDLDPQHSAAHWSRLRKSNKPIIVSGHEGNLTKVIEQARSGYVDLVLIDTAPKSESIAATAVKLSDIVLIPCQPSSLDLDAVADSVRIAVFAKKPTMFVLNNCRAIGRLADQAEEALSEYRLPIAPVRIRNRSRTYDAPADRRNPARESLGPLAPRHTLFRTTYA